MSLNVCLFASQLSRADTEPKPYGEGLFSYLNRSARPFAGRTRDLLERWFESYPDPAKIHVRSRFRSGDDYEHLSAFFEIYVHQLLVCLDLEVSVPEPNPGAADHRLPDFLVSGDEGEFFVEATIASDRSRAQMAAERRLNQVYDALNQLDCPLFFLRVEVHGEPPTPVPGGRLRDAVRRFLADLDPDVCQAAIERDGPGSVPTLQFVHEGWRIDVSPIPKSRERRGQSGSRPIGMSGPADVRIVDDRAALRDAVTSKAAHYGKLDLGLVVTVDAVNQDLDKIDIMEALFGKEAFTFPVADGQRLDPQMTRMPNGAWYNRNGPVNTRVSGVLVASRLRPETVARSTPVVYYNPWARQPIYPALSALPHNRPESDRMISYEGVSAVELFGLYSAWPGEE